MTTTTVPYPLQRDAPEAADAARSRFESKSSFFSWLRRRKKKPQAVAATANDITPQPTNATTSSSAVTQPQPPVASTSTDDVRSQHGIFLNGPKPEDTNNEKDIFEWAVLYENQRGQVVITIYTPPHTNHLWDIFHRITIFSTPYYSSQTLFPFIDPVSFTHLQGPKRRSQQPPLSLSPAGYPLPDGTWRWVSRAWMIDMRTNGEVTYDGFEYNWIFRKRGWSAHVGRFSFVRRRRWIRLMMRPGSASAAATKAHRSALEDSEKRQQRGGAYSNDSDDDPWNALWEDAGHVFSGPVKSADEDWARCQAVMRRAGRDGRKLELWHYWLGVDIQPLHIAEWTEDVQRSPLSRAPSSAKPPSPQVDSPTGAGVIPEHIPEPDLDRVVEVLRTHVSNIS
jgi:hypothetical protein